MVYFIIDSLFPPKNTVIFIWFVISINGDNTSLPISKVVRYVNELNPSPLTPPRPEHLGSE